MSLPRFLLRAGLATPQWVSGSPKESDDSVDLGVTYRTISEPLLVISQSKI